MMRRYVFLPALVVALVLGVTPALPGSVAHAQYADTPCPGGPRPGQVQIGVDVSGMPICRLADPGPASAPAAPPRMLPSQFNGIAWHPDYEDFWAVGGQTDKGTAARAALALCNRDTGGGCVNVAGAENGVVAVARRSDGVLYVNQWASANSAKKNVLNDCNRENVLPCEIVDTHGSKSGVRQPKDVAAARLIYGAAAWMMGTGYDGRAFVATGHRTQDEARQAALDACTRSYPGQTGCTISVFAGNGVIQALQARAKSGQMSDRMVQERDAKRAVSTAQVLCKREKAQCLIQASYSTRQPGLAVHNFNASTNGAAK